MATSSSPRNNEISPLPNHVAIVMDGNGRWAKERGLPRLLGHRAGVDNIHKVVEEFQEYHIPFLTLYAFSTENWGRPEEEVRGLFRILEEIIDRETQALHKKGVKIRHLGRPDGLSSSLKDKVKWSLELTKNNPRMTLSIAFNYGGRREIIDALRQIIKEGISAEELDEALLSRYLYTAGLPDPDFIIRTAGEMRLSNFLIWQAAYSEYYYTSTYWPDFNKEEIRKALLSYSQRQRRFGGL